LDNDSFIFDTEKNELGFTHCDAGVWLADKWNLPPAISIPKNYSSVCGPSKSKSPMINS
jgi:hypothetical protein